MRPGRGEGGGSGLGQGRGRDTASRALLGGLGGGTLAKMGSTGPSAVWHIAISAVLPEMASMRSFCTKSRRKRRAVPITLPPSGAWELDASAPRAGRSASPPPLPGTPPGSPLPAGRSCFSEPPRSPRPSPPAEEEKPRQAVLHPG